MHGLEVSGVSFYDSFEVAPLLEEELVFGRVGWMVVLDELVKLSVKMLDLIAGGLIDFAAPLHFRQFNNYSLAPDSVRTGYEQEKLKMLISDGKLQLPFLVVPWTEALVGPSCFSLPISDSTCYWFLAPHSLRVPISVSRKRIVDAHRLNLELELYVRAIG